MPTINTLRYPNTSQRPDVAGDIKNLAVDVDARFLPLELARVRLVTDLNALAAISSSDNESQIAHVDELNANFQATDAAWVQITTSKFADATARDTAYAKAAGAYRVVGARSKLASELFERMWSSTGTWKPDLSLGRVPIRPSSVAGTGVVLGADGAVSFAGGSTVSVNGYASADFVAYEYEMVVDSAAAAQDLGLRLRAAGVDNAASYVSAGSDTGTATGPTRFGSGATQALIGRVGSAGGYVFGRIVNPARVSVKWFTSTSFDSDAIFRSGGGAQGNAASPAHDGLTIFSTGGGVIAGTLRLFGINNI